MFSSHYVFPKSGLNKHAYTVMLMLQVSKVTFEYHYTYSRLLSSNDVYKRNLWADFGIHNIFALLLLLFRERVWIRYNYSYSHSYHYKPLSLYKQNTFTICCSV